MTEPGELAYSESVDDVSVDDLGGFFVGWQVVPTPEQHLELLRGSDHIVLARDGGSVIGYVTAVGDGVISAYIPLLEVLPDYQGRGIGSELMRRMLVQLERFYMVDVCCDASLEPFYRRFGMRVWDRGMGIRRPEAITRAGHDDG